MVFVTYVHDSVNTRVNPAGCPRGVPFASTGVMPIALAWSQIDVWCVLGASACSQANRCWALNIFLHESSKYRSRLRACCSPIFLPDVPVYTGVDVFFFSQNTFYQACCQSHVLLICIPALPVLPATDVPTPPLSLSLRVLHTPPLLLSLATTYDAGPPLITAYG